jgi:NhaP-type Na+/H+ or K+/H+ antiporter
MKEKKQIAPAVSLFSKDNYIWMIAGVVLVALGIILMSGGKSTDPNVFRENEVYSVRRITIAPIVILLGLGIEVYAIFKKPKNS